MPVVAAVGGFLGSAAGAATIGAAGAIGSTLLANRGNQQAANSVAGAAQSANDTQLQIVNQQRADQEPWRQAGIGALGQLTQLTQPGFDVQGWLSSQPGYQFGLNQGIGAITQSKAANGMLNSGSTLKALNQFGQDYAGTKFNESWNRLAGLAGIGQTATNQLGAAGQNYANQFGRNALAAGQARASSYQQQGQNQQNLIGGLAGVANNYLASRQPPAAYTPPYTTTPWGGQGYSTSGPLNGLF